MKHVSVQDFADKYGFSKQYIYRKIDRFKTKIDKYGDKDVTRVYICLRNEVAAQRKILPIQVMQLRKHWEEGLNLKDIEGITGFTPLEFFQFANVDHDNWRLRLENKGFLEDEIIDIIGR